MLKKKLDITNILEQNEDWEIEKYIRQEIVTDKENSYAECILLYKDNNKENEFSFSFINDNFLGMRTQFLIKAPKIYTNYLSEPFKKLSLNINEEYNKWFCDDIYIDDLHDMQKDTIEKFRKRAWIYEGVDDILSKKIYKKLINLNDREAYLRYAKFLRKQGEYDNAIEYLNMAINNYIDENNHTDLLKLYFEMVISYIKTENKTYSDAFKLMETQKEIFETCNFKEESSNKLLFLFLLLLRKYKNNNRIEIEKYINKDKNLEKINMKISKIIDRIPRTPIYGFLVWIDLIDSTKLKIEKYNEWYEKILYFLNMTTVIFDTIEYKTLKYIGDEVMLFRKISDNDDPTSLAKQIYDFIFDKQKWYFEELERFNPNKKEKIYVKICISYVEEIIELEDLKEENKYFDILGTDIDVSARIKNLATKKLIVANEKYVKLLHLNKGKYLKYFKEYKWKNIFKGNEEEITYYAEEIIQD